MCGTMSTTFSPSTHSTMRKTPCVEGCCGPMFSSISMGSAPGGPAAEAVAVMLLAASTIFVLNCDLWDYGIAMTGEQSKRP